MPNIFAAIPEELPGELVETLTATRSVRIERIVSRGHVSPERGWYDQIEQEWVILLQGEAVVAYENGSEVRLFPGDYIHIPAHCKHRVVWTAKDRDTVWLAIFLSDDRVDQGGGL